jgi:hypothetical protein
MICVFFSLRGLAVSLLGDEESFNSDFMANVVFQKSEQKLLKNVYKKVSKLDFAYGQCLVSQSNADNDANSEIRTRKNPESTIQSAFRHVTSGSSVSLKRN